MNYDEMPAGEEMNRLVAEGPMGWAKAPAEGVYRDSTGAYRTVFGIEHIHPVFRPSTNIVHAWEVVEKFISAGCSGWVGGDGHTGYEAGVTTDKGRFEAVADTAPLAICRAALKAHETKCPSGVIH